MSDTSHIWFRVNNLNPFSGRRVLKDFFDLQPLSLEIPSRFSTELNLSLKIWRQIDESQMSGTSHFRTHYKIYTLLLNQSINMLNFSVSPPNMSVTMNSWVWEHAQDVFPR